MAKNNKIIQGIGATALATALAFGAPVSGLVKTDVNNTKKQEIIDTFSIDINGKKIFNGKQVDPKRLIKPLNPKSLESKLLIFDHIMANDENGNKLLSFRVPEGEKYEKTIMRKVKDYERTLSCYGEEDCRVGINQGKNYKITKDNSSYVRQFNFKTGKWSLNKSITKFNNGRVDNLTWTVTRPKDKNGKLYESNLDKKEVKKVTTPVISFKKSPIVNSTEMYTAQNKISTVKDDIITETKNYDQIEGLNGADLSPNKGIKGKIYSVGLDTIPKEDKVKFTKNGDIYVSMNGNNYTKTTSEKILTQIYDMIGNISEDKIHSIYGMEYVKYNEKDAVDVLYNVSASNQIKAAQVAASLGDVARYRVLIEAFDKGNLDEVSKNLATEKTGIEKILSKIFTFSALYDAHTNPDSVDLNENPISTSAVFGTYQYIANQWQFEGLNPETATKAYKALYKTFSDIGNGRGVSFGKVQYNNGGNKK